MIFSKTGTTLKEFISFGSKRAIVFNLSSILIILRIIPTEKIGSLCIFKNYILPLIFKSCPTGGLFMACECPACGLTRATSYFLHGEVAKAMSLNKLVVFVLATTFTLMAINIYRLIKSK